VYLGRHKPFAWLKATFNRVNLSFDGPQDIHDAQRLKPDGQGSFEEVMEALRGLEAHGLSYGLRTTITRLGVGRMSEVVEFFHSVSSARTFHLEPLFECGRCRRTMTKAPSPADYIVNALAAQRLAARLGVKLHYSRSRLESVSDTSCGAAGRDLFVAPAGRATTCLEVCRDDDPRGAVFLVGAYQGASGAFVWDMRALGRLRRRVVGRVPHCRDCFAKYSGAGDCLARVAAQSGSMFRASGNQRCDINRALLLDEMRQREPSEGKKGDEETD
jgi:radical SAM protein with 4Fe4S-binding SPASM domain